MKETLLPGKSKFTEKIYNIRLYPVHPTMCRNKTDTTNTGDRDW